MLSAVFFRFLMIVWITSDAYTSQIISLPVNFIFYSINSVFFERNKTECYLVYKFYFLLAFLKRLKLGILSRDIFNPKEA